MALYDFDAPRLYVDAALDAGGPVPLEREQAHYLGTVLRLRDGDMVLVFNGREGEWRARLQLNRQKGSLVPLERVRDQTAAPTLVYAFAPLKHARLDYMVQKAVEMGAGILQPVLTRRTQAARINGERMRANAVEAAEQCGILSLPEIREPLRFDAFLAAWPEDHTLVYCDEDAPLADPVAALRPARGRPGPVGVLVGPEGGFDPAERAALLALPGHLRLSLGPRILRADTAAVAALAVVQAVIGDWTAPQA